MACFMLGWCVITLLYVALSESVGLYVTTVMKNMNGILPNDAEKFFIPDSQCSGYIDRSYLCYNQDADVVQVEVSDNVAFPRVRIDDSLRNATVLRSAQAGGRCAGEAEVQLSFNCRQSRVPLRQRRSVRRLPPAPRH